MPTSNAPAPQGRGSIRWHLILGVMALLLVVLGLVGGTLYTLLRGQTDARVASEFARVADEFEVLATKGIDPATGGPFTDPEALLRVTLERTVLAPTEDVIGFVDGTASLEVAGAPLKARQDPQLVEVVGPLSVGASVVDGVVRTDQREYRYLVAPVRFDGSARSGALVVVADMDAERRLLNQMMQGYLWIALATLVASSVIVALWMRHLLRPIAELRDTAARISEEDLSERVVVRRGRRAGGPDDHRQPDAGPHRGRSPGPARPARRRRPRTAHPDHRRARPPRADGQRLTRRRARRPRHRPG
ncbi:hypothetical protein [Propioniciclava sp. MC1683]|uniref:hypothetical protein n=1 Tax=Propioniciclava sp. MC1683 TaxID=2760309 RepID=UPI002107DEDB|nr:hypothetical protein [Propioniciclava sp. MC1683]